MYQRYGVYYTPDGALAARGAAWLGWDVARGRAVEHPVIEGLDIAEITATPRKYGFHGTIKPPFFLAPGKDFAGLQIELAQLCARLAPVQLEGLALKELAGFLALVPRGDQTALAGFAAQVVTKLDAFRAPPSEAEIARRRKTQLSAAQEQHLENWGYPYVMDEFRFHITLSGQLSDTAATMAQIAPYFEPVLPQPFDLWSLILVGQTREGMFHEIQRYPLTG
ncbi:MAG: DUF1045 domain-containing protein [Pseudomonadota bacterium]